MKSGDAITIESDEELNPFDEVKPFLFSCIPLLAIFFVKFTSQHFNDGLILLGLNLVAMRLNKSVMRQVQLKQNFSTFKCIRISLFALGSIGATFIAFREQQIWKSLFLYQLGQASYGMGLIWLVIYVDTILKLFAVSIKATVTLLSPKIFDFYRRGCLFSLIEYCSNSIRFFVPGVQLVPYIMSVVDPDSIRELYFTYLVFFIFIGLKAYFSIAELRKAANPAKQFLSPPEFGEKENKTISCDLSQKTITGSVITLSHRLGKVSYCESDLLHWMASYRSCPETGVIHSTLNFGSGQTRMNINLF